MARLEVRSVTKSFDGVAVLAHVDLDVKEGELVALVGPSGSGKSTLLRIIAGLERPDGGEVRIDGRRVETETPWSNGVAMVFQDEALYEHMTVQGNLSFPLLASGAGKEHAETRVREKAGRLRIRRILPRKPNTLSSGERGLVATGRALTRESMRVLLLDEPLARADRQVRQRFRREIIGLQRELGVATLLATNDQEEAMAIADRLVVIIEGRIAQVGPPLEVFEAPVSAEVAAFVGPLPMNLIPARVDRNGSRWHLEVGHDRVELDRELPPELHHRRVTVGIHPHELHVALPQTPFQHTMRVTVGQVEDLGGSKAVRFGLGNVAGVGFVWTERTGAVREAGDRCELTWDRSRLRLFDAETGDAISLQA
jgi:ABC-type sugar transport system ATPase subunit